MDNQEWYRKEYEALLETARDVVLAEGMGEDVQPLLDKLWFQAYLMTDCRAATVALGLRALEEARH